MLWTTRRISIARIRVPHTLSVNMHPFRPVNNKTLTPSKTVLTYRLYRGHVDFVYPYAFVNELLYRLLLLNVWDKYTLQLSTVNSQLLL